MLREYELARARMSENDSEPVCTYLDDYCEEIEVEEQDHMNVHALRRP